VIITIEGIKSVINKGIELITKICKNATGCQFILFVFINLKKLLLKRCSKD